MSVKRKIKDDNKAKLSALTIVLLVILVIYSISFLGLIFWGVMTAFKQNNILGYEKLTPLAYKLPKKWVWNFTNVFKNFTIKGVNYPDEMSGSMAARDVTMGMMFLYSFLYAFGCALASTITQCLTAYCCARFDYKFSKIIYTTVIIVMIIPIVGNLPSQIQMSKTFGLFNHIWGLWIMKANFCGMYFLVFYAMFKGIPAAYAEAAKIDGANSFSVLFRIILPVAKNTVFTVLLINFIAFWNDYQTPLKFMQSYPTLAYGLYRTIHIANTNGMDRTPYRMASAIMVLTPTVIVFLVFQKRLMGNLTVGGIKG